MNKRFQEGMTALYNAYRVHREQQIGVPPPSFTDRVATARKNGSFFRLFADRLRNLEVYLEDHKEDKQLTDSIPDIAPKVRHLEGKGSLEGSFFHRARWILLSWREYHRYARGPIATLYDAFTVTGRDR